MELSTITDLLSSEEILNNIEIISTSVYNNQEYKYIIGCKLRIFDKFEPILICIPEKWQMILVDIYIKNFEGFPFIPHIDKSGKLCIFDLEGVLIDKHLLGILSQSIKQAKLIIEDGLTGKNKLEFVEEFDSYWCKLPHRRNTKIVLPGDKKNQIIKYTEQKIDRHKNELSIYYKRRLDESLLYVAKDSTGFQRWRLEKTTLKNGFYFYYESEEYLYPPDFREDLKINFVNNLLLKLKDKDFNKSMFKTGRDKLLIFEIVQPNQVTVLLGFLIKNCVVSNYEVVSFSELLPLSLFRSDKEYLMTRTSNSEGDFKNKKILLIGCGSIGGYIANELVKSGFENLMLVDHDHFHEENIFRHLLGLEYVEQFKCVALEKYLSLNIPDLHITTLSEQIEVAVEEEDLNLENYDMIISAVGNHNVNRWLNEFMHLNKINIPVIYAWNEVLDIGNHVAYIQVENNGCYECFFGRNDETFELYDKTAYCMSGQKITRNLLGCGSSFIPYGSTTSLRTAALCTDTVKKVFNKEFSDNMIISSKGDSSYFIKAGLKVSNKYKKQDKEKVEYMGEQFVNCKCEVCRA